MCILNYSMKLFKFFKSQKGFTLIELLVVIGVLGILATGLLATIDPLEQFRKGSDSNLKTTALELDNALTRYYAVHNTFPWDTAANGGAACATLTVGTAVNVNTGFGTCLTTLQNEGELKSTFSSQSNILKNLWVTDTTSGSSKTVAVCFNPDSKSESKKPETKYGSATDHSPTNACDPTTSNDCNWCAQ